MSHLPGVLFFWKDLERPIDMILLQSDQSKSFEAWESGMAKTIKNYWNATIFCFIEDKDSEDNNVNQSIIQQHPEEKFLAESLQEALDKISGLDLVCIEDCLTNESDSLYVRQCTHRVINDNEITNIFKCVCRLLNILKDENVDRNFINTVKDY
ncbi:hypothetical protein PHYBLDRAFT_144251 [Phycomyces blakesleeanus NRRL 1555(-)]|uniref:Uncharacterized protein n=1 Tax=Phycomyces blakesleeanus (strain ATCC 8743b / DSM 1359 / FGSC 10004 / NBRC 33097 / NRRL 1555) TaxID=763407 RepID=A0A162NJW6_PHYB8|nr:hypothetical protein PHYBLDRAFT_144251 [Phycomyces blakesleeanus NRRL 1555(-)]OAD74898.1 hypothetical protein PHYBLDRAFT_144251 [Phycomyces blakesleeanus NRRL 1555(-)]|eukprot:XP_018292938.1 hypothetical protein PHYBLDRAFT_144251 [Phycomyces blakesleeanus NRRL 1555(-)]